MSVRSAVFFYTWDGNTRYLAESISAALSIPSVALEPDKSDQDTELAHYVWEDKHITIPKAPRLRPVDIDPVRLDLVFLGGPIWKGSSAPPLTGFLQQYEFSRIKFALFCSYSGRIGGYFQQLSKALIGNKVLGTIGFREPLNKRNASSQGEIAAWAREIYQKAGGD